MQEAPTVEYQQALLQTARCLVRTAAGPPPGTLRFYLRDGDTQWSELYACAENRTADTPVTASSP